MNCRLYLGVAALHLPFTAADIPHSETGTRRVIQENYSASLLLSKLIGIVRQKGRAMKQIRGISTWGLKWANH